MSVSNVRIKLTTRDEDLKVDENPINVPVDLKRYGLSEIINQLLENSEPISFDFLIDGKLLKGSLQDFMRNENLSSESIIEIEYVQAVEPPTFMAAYEHDDWVSGVHINKSISQIATGSYDGCVRIWDSSAQVKHTFSGHQGAVLSVKWLGDNKVVSGSRDRNLHIWNTDGKELSAILKGHTGPVTSLSVLSRERIVSGSADHTLKVWTSRIKELPDYEAPELSHSTSSSVKRRKIADKHTQNAKVKGSLLTLEGHLASVTDVCAHPIEKDVVYSVSEDHTVRTWDLVTSQNVDTKTTGFSLLSIASLGPTTQLLACGSSARHIILVDPRSATHASVNQLNGHKNFVVSIAPNPQNSYQFASGSHDGTIRIWDVRSDKSMFTLERQQKDQDVYCLDWADYIAAGGRDKQLELYNI
ncbi:Ytm1 protein [Starmerella bacillaris]|uniref:Ribosome biogenesis protein YTM1 n=1 Tax=Starmerella bacillaris TaxID=1247836 RepID=A0AAV5RRD5_STABA|nr:Ytm1 protein [Starmerella bacillaris]